MIQGGDSMSKSAKNMKTERLISIDCPKTNETIRSGHYAARISAPSGNVIELAIDGGNWELCRNEADHWWFDIQGLADGEHELAARSIRNGENGLITRKFKISRE
jgi:hypothetical protein